MGVINEFQALMSRAEGFARLARYQVMLAAPAAINFPNYARNISLMCDTIVMPGHDLQTHPAKYGTGLATEMVNGHKFEGTIAATFYMENNLRTQSYFNLWQHAAVNRQTNKVSYYKNAGGKHNYAGTMKIYQLSSVPTTVESRETAVVAGGRTIHKDRSRVEGPRNEHGEQVLHNVTKRAWGMEVLEVYPETIGSIEYAYATVDTLALLPVQFQYKKWKTIHPNKLNE